MPVKNIYKIVFFNQGKVYEIFARRVYQGDLYGFVVVEDLVFGERSTVVVDPSEERLKTEFEYVKRAHIPMHAVARIDEVEKQGVAKISDAGANVAMFPSPMYSPGGGKKE
ncbi:MAG TPA: DUF1820 family protein [Gammaproteobacteria bacterium]|jgi:hypothetical protein|nr:DUF1820 family protein [Pseudomonadota bacterium]HEX2239293.1 DUF1820 family protein [Gammaproteobacteria bacterium]